MRYRPIEILMTETEWMTSKRSSRMLNSCRRFIMEQPRKGRLFAIACCYRIWHLLIDLRSRAAVETASEFAEGLATCDQLEAAETSVVVAQSEAFRAKVGGLGERAARFVASLNAWVAATNVSAYALLAVGNKIYSRREDAAQADLLRCIFGPLPFRSVLVEQSWLRWNDATVVKLAQAIYNERAFDRLPILADALEEAGCDNADLLAHCRGGVVHVRGC